MKSFFTGQYCECGGEVWSDNFGYSCKKCGKKHIISPTKKLYVQKENEMKKEKPLSKDVFVLQYDSMRYLLGSRLLFADKVAKSISKLKREWKAKCKRMEVMSGEVADYELKMLIQDIIGEIK